ncbi:PepSY domain-containing protein [Thermostichus vulcanus]|uniref:PepSY domain-containing protein n=1 Tax=Thermostichus vulcanus str. 'Rupite' TaxID=2813851 RepID=A0ABT0C9Z0_THEVL|nr:PepSY domain-containing protein [Thermostichus vulcanus]MCJ2542576.1 PepSY domain-containing protein [Thermostichus vulcanus str. 'Rupite']
MKHYLISWISAVLLSGPMLLLGVANEPAVAQSSAPAIRTEEAIQIARGVVPNGVIKEVELERKDGRLIWEIEFTNDIEVKIDANSGDIVDIDD